MKPPVKYEDLVREWEADAKMDMTEPAMEAARVPTLHAKYLHILTAHRVIARKAENDYKELKLFREQYYRGAFNNPEDLEKYNLEPFKKQTGLDVATYIEADKELNMLLLKKTLQDEIVNFATRVVTELNQRTWQTGNIIKWQMFTRGSL